MIGLPTGPFWGQAPAIGFVTMIVPAETGGARARNRNPNSIDDTWMPKLFSVVLDKDPMSNVRVHHGSTCSGQIAMHESNTAAKLKARSPLYKLKS